MKLIVDELANPTARSGSWQNMAWVEGKIFIYLFIYLFLYFFIYLFIYLFFFIIYFFVVRGEKKTVYFIFYLL